MSSVIGGILIATLVVGLTGIIIAVLLSIAGEKFKEKRLYPAVR